MIVLRILTIGIVLFVASLSSFAQITNPAAKKFNVYKIDVNPNATKEGIRGIAILFSTEYNFSDPEYASLKDKQGKVYLTFYAALTDANNEPAYNAFDYSFYQKINQTTALHFARENVYEPQNKSQGRRNTGIELFIPFTHTTLPEGSNPVKFSLNASTEKGTRFENIYSQSLTIQRPPAYGVSVTPKQITVFDKSGKPYPAGQLEQDLFLVPGANKAAKDVSAAANVDLNESLGFVYSEGDVLRLKVEKSTQKGLVRTNKARLLRSPDGKSLGNFNNAAALTGEWALDAKAGKMITLKNNAMELKLEVNRYRIPAIRLSGLSVNPLVTQEGVAGMSVSFTPEVTLLPELPYVEAHLSYRPSSESPQVSVTGGKVISGKAQTDTTGSVRLDKSAQGKITVFYPAFNLLLSDPDVRQKPPKYFLVQVRLPNNPSVVAQKSVKQDLSLGVLKDFSLSPAVVLKDTVYANEHGLTLSIPYKLPALYFELMKGERYVSLYGTQDARAMELLRRMTPIGTTKRMNAADKKLLQFEVVKPDGKIHLFLPYTSLTKIEATPIPFSYRGSVSKEGQTVATGEGTSALRFETDRQKLRFITVGIANIKLKRAESGNVAWRIKAGDKVLYQSNPIPVAKSIENLYTDAFYIHEDDKLTLEFLKGASASDMKPALKWESPVKSLKATEQIELDPAKQTGSADDGDTKTVTVSYTTQ